MELIKKNFELITETKARALSSDYVVQRLTEKELKIAQIGAKRMIKEIPDQQEVEGKQKGLVYLAGIIAKGICRDYSIRNADEAQVFRFYTTIRDYYNTFTLDEVRVAFELALVGELDNYLPTDSSGNPDKSAYQNFSQEFICKILNAYKKYRSKVWGKVYSLEAKEPREISEEEKKEHLEGFKGVLKEQYETWLSGSVPFFMFAKYTAMYLVSRGFVVDREITESDRRKAYQVLMTEPMDQDSRERLKNALNGMGENNSLESVAEQMKNRELIIKAFENIRDKNLTI